MLGEILISYKGTLLLVSHDRDFLDQTVTKILSFEGDGVLRKLLVDILIIFHLKILN